MEAGKEPFEKKKEVHPSEVLRQIIAVCENKGWLNETVRIKYHGRIYRISCDGHSFMAYRINENLAISPGLPGWPVCIINQDQIIEDSKMCSFPTDELSALDWLRCLSDSGFETI